MTTQPQPDSAPKARLISLDVLRGFTILAMLLVNNIGSEPSTPRQLLHSGWSGGLTLADFVFPWFLFCVGVAIPFSAAAFTRKGLPAWRYDLKAVQRTLILVALGWAVTSSAAGRPVFSLGVLQLIGISYFAAAMLYELPLHRRAMIVALALLGYWGTILYVPIPGVGPGFFQEGLNIVHHLNRKLLAPVGLEGLPLVIPTSSVVLIGTMIGDLIRREDMDEARRTEWLGRVGVGLVVLGVICGVSLPPNKPLWTPSFALLAAGTAAILLLLFHWLFDQRGCRVIAFPFAVFGSNAILAYVAPIVTKNLVLHELHVSTGGLLRVSLYTCFWWLVLYLLYRKRIFLKV
jgi:predicted acyltransferase